MKKNGASKEEIRAAVIDLYVSYGGSIPELTDDQKEDIHDWIVDMLNSDYGFDIPDLTPQQREAIKQKKEEIKSLQKELRILLKNADKITKYRFYKYVKNEMNPPKNKSTETNIFSLFAKILSRIQKIFS
jgi:hypothetical protein